jgi:SecD/SecF fusion protein
MRNKGFYWFISVALIVVCLFQLSYTWVASSVEGAAELKANQKVKALRLTAKNGIAFINNDSIDFNSDGADLAKAAYLNEILREKGDTAVYPVFGNTFSQVKNRSLAFGLDLVGGMSVTLEISLPDLIKSYANFPRSLAFREPFEAAEALMNKGDFDGDFLDAFIFEYNKERKGDDSKISSIFKGEGIGVSSTDAQVEQFFRKLISSSMDNVEEIMIRRINQFGVAQPNIQKDLAKNRLYIELPGVLDENTVAKKLQSTANLEFFETYIPSQLTTEIDIANAISLKTEVEADSTTSDPLTLEDIIADKKVGEKGLGDYLNIEKYKGFPNFIVAKKDKASVEAILRRNDVMEAFSAKSLDFKWGAEPEVIFKNSKEEFYNLYACVIPSSGKAEVNGSHIEPNTASVQQDNGKQIVELQMTADGSDAWGKMTTRNVDRFIAITMDNLVYSAPQVKGPITGGKTQISGKFTSEEANELKNLLNAGALTAPCIIKELIKVGPTIGKENSQAGLISFVFAFIAVLFYMYFYYGKSGLAANIALTINVVFIFGILAAWGGVLTLAGIAGIVLTIGTAVDANILIFERIREEQYKGMDLTRSVDVGFKKALPSIIDANVTHLLVAIILKIVGTGEIESFATTLLIGIFTSMFSAIIISKLVIHSWMKKGQGISFFTKLSKGLFQNLKFDWIGNRKYFYIFSISVTILGVIGMTTRGLKQSVEFTGGRTYVAKFDKKADIEYMRANLSKFLVEKGEIASIDLKTKGTNFKVEINTNFKLNDDGASNEVRSKIQQGIDACKDKMGRGNIVEERNVSASISRELWSSSAWAIGLALVAIFAYIFLRFGHWQYSLGAIVGLAHDAFFVISIFSLLHGYLPFSLDVNQAFIAAILTVIGYSMNDTVIVFDRIRENLRNSKGDEHHYDIINKSLNTTLSRTFNTSMILFVVVLIMFIFGGPAIKGFLFALLVGVVIGTYSSLCVATPILIDFSKRLKA